LDGVTKPMQSATTGIHNLDFDKFKDLDICVPPLTEQKCIVKTLDEKFSKIDKLKNAAEINLKNAREIFNAELEKTFHGKGSWKTVRLGNCGTLKNGMNFTASDSGYTIHSLGVGDFKNLYQISDTKSLSKISLKAPPPEDYLLKDGDIVFVRSNGNKELVGRCVLVYPGKTPTTYSGFCIRFRKEFDELDSDFLLHFLKSDQSRKILNGKEGANISNLNQKILSNFEVPLPPLSEQKRIVAHLDKLSKKVKRLEEIYRRTIADCEELKKSILKQVFEVEA
jgi:type I restriction enzyme S subunit